MTSKIHHRTALLVSAACLVPLSCRFYTDYTPRPLDSTSAARQVIYEVLEQQPGPYAATEVQLTNKKFSMSRRHATGFLGMGGIGTIGTTIYYDKIGDLLLSKKRGVFTVTIRSPNRVLLLHVYTVDQASAERFIDALETMRRAAPDTRVPAEPDMP